MILMVVSLLSIGDFEVLATAGDTHLGGEDFDIKVSATIFRPYPSRRFYRYGTHHLSENASREDPICHKIYSNSPDDVHILSYPL